VITNASFPTPEFALHTNDEKTISQISKFAQEQAQAATAALPALAANLASARSSEERATAYRKTYQTLIHWRADLARRTTRHDAVGLADDPARYLLSITKGGANYDRLGYIGRLRENSVWHPPSRTYRGGEVTPAHRIMLEYGQLALSRFAAEHRDGDTLSNLVTLPDSSTIVGNKLVRGAAAREVAEDLLTRIDRRGADPTRIETGGDPIYAVTAPDRARERMFHTAMAILGTAEHGEVSAWQVARYLLYQAPLTKRGSDAVIRTFLVTVGTFLFGQAPVLAQDVDLRCIVAGQPNATTMHDDPQGQPHH
jgi:hypothetical protein